MIESLPFPHTTPAAGQRLHLPGWFQSAQAMLFDMDGVLIDSEPVHAAALQALAIELGGRMLSESVILGFKGVPDREVARMMSELFPKSGRTPADLKQRAFELYEERFALVKLIPGAASFASCCKESGRRMAVATSAAASMQRMAFDAFALHGYFETVVTAEDVQRGKPDPEPYLLAAERLGVSPADCVVVEDSLNGVRSGKAAGCHVIGIATSFPAAALHQVGADLVIAKYEELVPRAEE